MEYISSDTAEFLHINGFHPYSQSVMRCDAEMFVWQICTLNAQMKKEIIDVLLQEDVKQITLKKKNLTLDIARKEYQELSYKELLEQNYFTRCSRLIKLSFLTPTSFKIGGEYQIFPTVKLIFQSLMLKYDAAASDSCIFSEELLQDYADNTQIIAYRLKSVLFHLEGIKIPSFLGEITLKITGPQQMVNLAHMLISFGQYSGVGIKSGIGMGCISLIPKDNKKLRRKG